MLAVSRAVLPPPASGTTAQAGTTAVPSGTTAQRYYREILRYYRDTNRAYPPDRFTLFTSSGLLHLISLVLCCCFLGWSGDGSRQHLKRKATGASGSSSVKRTAQKNKAPQVPIDVLPLTQYRSYRQVNPYREEQDPSLVGTKFWNKRQQEVYNMIPRTGRMLLFPM